MSYSVIDQAAWRCKDYFEHLNRSNAPSSIFETELANDCSRQSISSSAFWQALFPSAQMRNVPRRIKWRGTLVLRLYVVHSQYI